MNGVIGFGGENSGILTRIDSAGNGQFTKGCIAFSTVPINLEFLKLASDAGVSGIIAPSIPASDWVRYNGEELGVAITGDEDIPFTLILTSGFGSTLISDIHLCDNCNLFCRWQYLQQGRPERGL